MKDKKSSKLKTLIGKLLGISEWKLKEDGHLDINTDELTRMTGEYGSDFVAKFEKLLNEENEDKDLNINQTQSEMPKELKLALLCALLSVDALQAADDGSVTLSKEQLDAVEAGLKKLQDEKSAADAALTAATSEKDNAVNALSGAVTAMEDLDVSVKEAKDPAAKVEAIRKKLAEKPAVNATGALNQDGIQEKKIKGNDEVNAFVSQYF